MGPGMTERLSQVRPPIGTMKGRWEKAVREFEKVTGIDRTLLKDGELNLTESDLKKAAMVVNKNFFSNSFPVHEVLWKIDEKDDPETLAYSLGKNKIGLARPSALKAFKEFSPETEIVIDEGKVVRSNAQRLLQFLAHEMIHSANSRWAPIRDLQYDFHGPVFHRNNRLFNGLDTVHDYFGHSVPKKDIPYIGDSEETFSLYDVKRPPVGASETGKKHYSASVLPYTLDQLEEIEKITNEAGVQELKDRDIQRYMRTQVLRKKPGTRRDYPEDFLPLDDREDPDTRDKRRFVKKYMKRQKTSA
eukprot:jgi/Mesvir1/17775/Mv04386-RA.1